MSPIILTTHVKEKTQRVNEWSIKIVYYTVKLHESTTAAGTVIPKAFL